MEGPLRLRLSGALLGVGLALVPRDGLAQHARRAERQRMLEQAAEASGQGRHADALRLAVAAGAIEMRAGTRMFIAQQQLALADWLAAHETALQCIGEARVEARAVREQIERNCREVEQQAEARVGRIDLRLPSPPPPGLRVWVNDEELDPALWRRRLRVSVDGVPQESGPQGITSYVVHYVLPGEVTVTAQAAEERFQERFRATAGTRHLVALALRPPSLEEQLDAAQARDDHDAVLRLATALDAARPSPRWLALLAVEHERLGATAGQEDHVVTAAELAGDCVASPEATDLQRGVCAGVQVRTADRALALRRQRDAAERARQEQLARQREEATLAVMARGQEASRPRPTPVGALVLYGLAGLSAAGAGVFIYLYEGEADARDRLCKPDDHGGAACPDVAALNAAHEHQERAMTYGPTGLALLSAGVAFALGAVIWSGAAGALRPRESGLRFNVSPLAGGAAVSLGGAL